MGCWTDARYRVERTQCGPFDPILIEYLDLDMPPPERSGSKPDDLEAAREHGEITAELKAHTQLLDDGKASFKELRDEVNELGRTVAVIQSQWGSHSALVARYVAPIAVMIAFELFKTFVLKR